MRDGGIYFESFKGCLAALFLADIAYRSHVMQSVRKLDDNNTDIVGHGEEHLADIFRLRLRLCLRRHLCKLRHAVYKLGYLIAEIALYVGLRDIGILNRIVQQRRRHGLAVHAEIR